MERLLHKLSDHKFIIHIFQTGVFYKKYKISVLSYSFKLKMHNILHKFPNQSGYFGK